MWTSVTTPVTKQVLPPEIQKMCLTTEILIFLSAIFLATEINSTLPSNQSAHWRTHICNIYPLPWLAPEVASSCLLGETAIPWELYRENISSQAWRKPPSFIPLPVVLGGVCGLYPQLDSLALNTVSYFITTLDYILETSIIILWWQSRWVHFLHIWGKWSWPSNFIYSKGSLLKYDVISCINSADKCGLIFSLLLGISFLKKKTLLFFFFFQCCFLFNLVFGKQHIHMRAKGNHSKKTY